ncbi:hypothetical protein ABTM61_19210, partial [Acinetobacter baumannii]
MDKFSPIIGWTIIIFAILYGILWIIPAAVLIYEDIDKQRQSPIISCQYAIGFRTVWREYYFGGNNGGVDACPRF